jgi:hypothetical protein
LNQAIEIAALIMPQKHAENDAGRGTLSGRSSFVDCGEI